ncbi:MAG TPA: hypothetical protein PLI45_00415 [Candidatus Woesebacteria bacterium]|nr:hypothetical protein [Candidatus Woesebacteria bacterium]
MPSVLGQVGQSVADNLFEIGQSAVKGTVKAAKDIAGESIEQITSAPVQATAPVVEKPASIASQTGDESKKRQERQRLEEVKAELAQFIQRKQQLDQRIEQEKTEEVQQEKVLEQRKKQSWVSRVINRSQTNTERGRLQE